MYTYGYQQMRLLVFKFIVKIKFNILHDSYSVRKF